MRRQFKTIIFFLGISMLLYSCGENIKIISKVSDGFSEILTIKSTAISKNKIEDDGIRNIRIDLPPDYYSSGKRYPVMYFFHNYAEWERQFEQIGAREALNENFKSNQVKSFIIVNVNSYNNLGGNFYVNSKTTGNWEDHFVNELIPMIDESYRTIPEKASRVIVGFSMGGFGALHIGLAHPEYFSGVWAHCPDIFAPEDGLKDALVSWSGWTSIKEAYGAAFANDAENFPSTENPKENKKLYEKWLNGYGNWQNRIDKYKQANSDIRIKFGLAKMDNFEWVNNGSKYLNQVLKKNGIDSEINEYATGHYLRDKVFLNNVVPFVQEILVFE